MLGKFSISLTTNTLLLEYTQESPMQPISIIYHLPKLSGCRRRKPETTRPKPLNVFLNTYSQFKKTELRKHVNHATGWRFIQGILQFLITIKHSMYSSDFAKCVQAWEQFHWNGWDHCLKTARIPISARETTAHLLRGERMNLYHVIS